MEKSKGLQIRILDSIGFTIRCDDVMRNKVEVDYSIGTSFTKS